MVGTHSFDFAVHNLTLNLRFVAVSQRLYTASFPTRREVLIWVATMHGMDRSALQEKQLYSSRARSEGITAKRSST